MKIDSMSARTALHVMGLASAQPAVATPTTGSLLARTLSTCAAVLKLGSKQSSAAPQRCLSASCTAALPRRASSTAAAPLTGSQSSCKHLASVSSSLAGVRITNIRSASGALAHAAAQPDSPQLSHTLHTSAASPAAQAARAATDTSTAPDDMLAGAPGDPELTDMIQPELLQTPGGQIAYHALPATGSHLTGVIYCGGEAASSD